MDIPFRKIHIPNYKVKAFLGDSILEFVLTKRIYEKEHGTIGRMSKRLNHLKSNFYLSKIYDYIIYHKYILPDDRNFNIHSKGTMVEAFICFAYQQKGLDYTEELINYLYTAIKRWRKP